MASNERGDVSDPVTREEIDAVAGDELDVREQLVRARRSCVRLSDLHEAAEKRADAAERKLADFHARVREAARGGIIDIRATWPEAFEPEGGTDAG